MLGWLHTVSVFFIAWWYVIKNISNIDFRISADDEGDVKHDTSEPSTCSTSNSEKGKLNGGQVNR